MRWSQASITKYSLTISWVSKAWKEYAEWKINNCLGRGITAQHSLIYLGLCPHLKSCIPSMLLQHFQEETSMNAKLFKEALMGVILSS